MLLQGAAARFRSVMGASVRIRNMRLRVRPRSETREEAKLPRSRQARCAIRRQCAPPPFPYPRAGYISTPRVLALDSCALGSDTPPPRVPVTPLGGARVRVGGPMARPRIRWNSYSRSFEIGDVAALSCAT